MKMCSIKFGELTKIWKLIDNVTAFAYS